MSFLKKALGAFVEFDDSTQDQKVQDVKQPAPVYVQQSQPVFSQNPVATTTPSMNQSEMEKFEKYFDNLFEKANLPGPDYFEFHKMMETLEPHIHDEKARISATFASLSIQGLTKEMLISAAGKYKEMLEKDSIKFSAALDEKIKSEVGQRQSEQDNLSKKIQENSDLVIKLTKEITDAQIQIEKLKTEMEDSQGKLNANSVGYKMASQSMINMISTDIQKIQETI